MTRHELQLTAEEHELLTRVKDAAPSPILTYHGKTNWESWDRIEVTHADRPVLVLMVIAIVQVKQHCKVLGDLPESSRTDDFAVYRMRTGRMLQGFGTLGFGS